MPHPTARSSRRLMLWPALAACALLAISTGPARASELVLGAEDLSAGASQVVLSLGAPPRAVAQPVAAEGFDPADIDGAVAHDAVRNLPQGAILQTGVASYYGRAWKGRRTASGTRYNPEALTAASPTLPLGTRVLVTLEGTARSVLVTITDRQGTAARVIDLSVAAARRLGMLVRGTARVTLRRA